jgi:glycosyltransferase involved in cell wall biosynthesis
MKLCFVVQRYGLDVTGGAELHCRWLAERLARRHDVQVVTTCARDYVEWRNHYPPGQSEVSGIRVWRYPVQRPRDHQTFSALSRLVFDEPHTPDDERRWVVENGPVCPELVESLAPMRDVDLFIFYSYRYYQSFFGLSRVARRAVLVPTAEEDPAIRMAVFAEMFRWPRGLIYLTPEEQQLIERVSGNQSVPSVVIGTGIEVPPGWQAIDVRAKFQLPPRFLLYVGRIDRNKGVDELFRYYEWLKTERIEVPPLVLAGERVAPVPDDPAVRHLGRVSDEEKFALLAAADLLLMPSPYESLSIVVLEAWALGRPVLANARCKVLEGQCLRSNGGLFYRDYAEFATTLRMLVERADLRAQLGTAGQAYVQREYDWQVVEARLESFLATLAADAAQSRPA